MYQELRFPSKRAIAWSFLYIATLNTLLLIVYIGLIRPASDDSKHGTLRYVGSAAPEANGRVFVHGIFTVPENQKERDVHRSTWMSSPLVCTIANDKIGCAIAVYFVMGLVPNGSRRLIERENATRADLIELDIIENMNSGKTFDWFRFAARHFTAARFISKGDMDTYIYPGELLRSVNLVSHGAQRIYGGFIVDYNLCGGGAHCPYGWVYMAGGFYFLSQDLVQWLGSVNNTIARDNSEGHEDLQVGKCLYVSGMRILYMSWSYYSKPAWVHPIKNTSSFYESFRKNEAR